MAARKIKAKGSGGLEVHGRTYRARYFKLDPRNPTGFSRVTEGTGIRADGSDPEDCDPLTGDPDPKRARARAEQWLEEHSAPYRKFIQHGRFVEDAAKLAKVAKDAQAKTEGKVLEAERDLAAAEDKLPAYTLEAAWVAFDRDLDSRQRDQATQRNYCQWYHIFTDWLEANYPDAKELRSVSSAIAREYARHLLESGRRGTTFNRHLNALALIWGTLAARELDGKAKFPEARLGGNPFRYDKASKSGIPRIKLEKTERPHKRRDLQLEEIAKLLTTATGEVRVLIALGFYTGLRLGDCVTLQVSNVDRVLGTIKTRSRKTDEETETAIHPRLAQIMNEGITARRGYLLPELAKLYTGGGITGKVEITKRVAAVFHECGIETSYKRDGEARARPDCGFHSLRHAYAKQLKKAGVAIANAQKLMGHATARMTAHYSDHPEATEALALPDIFASQTGESGAQGAATAGGVIALPAPADATEGGYARACAIVDGMGKAELRKLAKYITKRLGK